MNQGNKMLYETYNCNVKDVKICSDDEESYEIPGFEGARISKLAPPGKILAYKYDDATTMIEMMERGCRVSDNGPCVGWRSSDLKYSWLSYKEFLTRAKHFGSGLISLGVKLDQLSYISIYAQNSVEWLISQYGCFYYSAIVVPLYDTIGPDSRTFMINLVETRVVICDVETKVIDLLKKLHETPTLEHIILINDVSEETKKLGKEKGINLHLLEEIEEIGKLHAASIKLPKPTDTALLCFTSGTTGIPKGAVLTHKAMIAGISGTIDTMGELKPTKDDVAISYLPLAHVFEQVMQILMFLNGGKVGFFCGDVSRLTNDMKILRPTILAAVPRVLNKIYDQVNASIRKLKNNAKQNEEDFFDENDSKQQGEEIYDPRMLKPVLESLGSKLRLIVCGSAPISEKVLNFYRLALNIEVMEVYGQTESSGPIAVNVITKKSLGTVGPPLPSCMVKFVDVPELGYFKENKIGEICVKGPIVFKGYLRDLEKTEKTIDKDGWLHTGDVGVWLPSGIIKIINRTKHIFKLAQGEYVIPEKIENVYEKSPFITQILVHGDSTQDYLVAIVVPDQDKIIDWCQKNFIQDTWNNICKNPVVKQLILDDMQRLAKYAGLVSFQQVKDIYIHPQLLTIEEGHLTPTQKVKRETVRKLFMEKIQSMYNQNLLTKLIND